MNLAFLIHLHPLYSYKMFGVVNGHSRNRNHRTTRFVQKWMRRLSLNNLDRQTDNITNDCISLGGVAWIVDAISFVGMYKSRPTNDRRTRKYFQHRIDASRFLNCLECVGRLNYYYISLSECNVYYTYILMLVVNTTECNMSTKWRDISIYTDGWALPKG